MTVLQRLFVHMQHGKFTFGISVVRKRVFSIRERNSVDPEQIADLELQCFRKWINPCPAWQAD